jgi:hypothetical protein
MQLLEIERALRPHRSRRVSALLRDLNKCEELLLIFQS